jgi:hypothetical protein
MTATITATEAAAARETLQAKYRQDRRESIYEGKVWFTKERDKYGRTVRYVKTCKDGDLKTIAAVVCVPRWTPELKASMGITRYFSNDWRVPGVGEDAVVNADTLKAALARFNCGTKEYELYPA